ncbi:MAG: hypothetical protein QNJ47_02905 [Nostocaceae cyanobacterium]|nr:hypothetical protein [Nostocaceae cyanobacterium]
MTTQQLNSSAFPSHKSVNDVLAILFFMIGALHIYQAVRKRKIQAAIATKVLTGRYFQFGLLAIAIAGMIEIFAP